MAPSHRHSSAQRATSARVEYQTALLTPVTLQPCPPTSPASRIAVLACQHGKWAPLLCSNAVSHGVLALAKACKAYICSCCSQVSHDKSLACVHTLIGTVAIAGLKRAVHFPVRCRNRCHCSSRQLQVVRVARCPRNIVCGVHHTRSNSAALRARLSSRCTSHFCLAAVVRAGYYLTPEGQAAPCPRGEWRADSNATTNCTKCAAGVNTGGMASASESECRGKQLLQGSWIAAAFSSPVQTVQCWACLCVCLRHSLSPTGVFRAVVAAQPYSNPCFPGILDRRQQCHDIKVSHDELLSCLDL
jgi:hypothetical protein